MFICSCEIGGRFLFMAAKEFTRSVPAEELFLAFSCLIKKLGQNHELRFSFFFEEKQ
jgi:hypothetical protein